MRIETSRLVLREFRDDDSRDMLSYWRDPRYGRFNPIRDNVDQTVRELVGRFVSAQSDPNRHSWQLAITLRGDDLMIGNCGIRINDPDHREANIGYELNPDVWGNGYATEAARAIVHLGFTELGLHRIWAECIADNTASAHVLDRLDMRQEAHFHEHQYFRDRWWDTLIYAMLVHEWRPVDAPAISPVPEACANSA